MQSAITGNGKIVTAKEYDSLVDGVRLFCIDKSCKAPVIFVNGSEEISAYFKTTGKEKSVHSPNCGFYRKMSFEETVNKVNEYQKDLQEHGVKEIVIRLNMNGIDPDIQKKEVEREEKTSQQKDLAEVKVKQESSTPNTLGSLKAVTKLISQNSPDILASIIISVKGNKIPISELISSVEDAHQNLWDGKTYENTPYFVHGTIESVKRRERVWYITLNSSSFSIVVFNKYFKHFTYSDNQLIGKKVLVYGFLKKNSFKENINRTEIYIKSNKYLEFLV